MKKKPIIVALVLLIAALITWFCLERGGWSKRSYTAICMKCLAKKHGVEKRLFGRVISTNESAPSAGRCYETLMDEKCEHRFRKMGFCHYRGLFYRGGISCGSYSGSPIRRVRLTALEFTYDAFERIGDRNLAVRTYELIDQILPPDANVHSPPYRDHSRYLPLLNLTQELPTATDSTVWERLLEKSQVEQEVPRTQ